MANLNKVFLIGRLTRDPQLRYTPSGTPVADLGMAVNRFRKGQDGQSQEETAFVDVTLWSKMAETATQYLKKGRQVFFEGHLKFDQWDSPEGQRRSKLTVVAEKMEFLDGRGDGDNAGGRSSGSQAGDRYASEEGQSSNQQQHSGNVPPEDEIPF